MTASALLAVASAAEPEAASRRRAGRSWARAVRAAAAVALVAAGLAAAAGTGWAFVAARQAVQGRLVAFAAPAPRTPPAVTAPVEVAENTP